jgi:hypothetical protein
MQKSGSADLPLHNGHVPKWLADRMTRLGAVMTEAIVHHYGRDEFLRRLAHPFWFQSFGAVMGMDWHSSGITTSVLGALKRGLTPLSHELGLHVCGGRGNHSRLTPRELTSIGDRIGFDGGELATASRLVAKVDSAAVQDGFDLYLHGFVVTDEGRWVVVQQGMNGERKQARRYHWLSEGLKSFVDEPHAAIEGPSQGDIINLTDRRAENSRCEARSTRPSSTDRTRCLRYGSSIRNRGGWSARQPARVWKSWSPPSSSARTNMAAAACSVLSRRRRTPIKRSAEPDRRPRFRPARTRRSSCKIRRSR